MPATCCQGAVEPTTPPSTCRPSHMATTMSTDAPAYAHGTAAQSRPGRRPSGKTRRSARRPARFTGQAPTQKCRATDASASGSEVYAEAASASLTETSDAAALVQARAGPTGEPGARTTTSHPTTTATRARQWTTSSSAPTCGDSSARAIPAQGTTVAAAVSARLTAGAILVSSHRVTARGSGLAPRDDP